MINPLYIFGAIAAAAGAYWYGTRNDGPTGTQQRLLGGLSRPSTAPQRPSNAAPAPAPQPQQAGTVETLLSYGAEYGDDAINFIAEIGSDANTSNANSINAGKV